MNSGVPLPGVLLLLASVLQWVSTYAVLELDVGTHLLFFFFRVSVLYSRFSLVIYFINSSVYIGEGNGTPL